MVFPSPSSAPLTFKDGTALALSCMADYGAPVFPFLTIGGYKGKLSGSRGGQQGGIWGRSNGQEGGVVMGFLLPGVGLRGLQTCLSCLSLPPPASSPVLLRSSGLVPGPKGLALG